MSCLTSVEWDDQILFSCSLISSSGEEWQIYIHQSKPIWSHLQLCVDTETQKTSLQKKRRFHLKQFPSFLSFSFTAFYLPLVHTMEAIVAFPAAKTGHKVLSNLCHMARLCFALPTASPLKKLRPQWHESTGCSTTACTLFAETQLICLS